MPIRQFIVHIGRHKSGTSSLQHFMSRVGPRLGAQGVLYPRAGSDNRVAHHALARACNARTSDGAALEAMRTAMLAEIEPHHDRIMVSSEAFQNLRDVSRLAAFIESLGATEVQVICYVREHLDYAISSFRQMVQNQTRFSTFAEHAAGLRNMDEFVARWAGLGAMSLKWYNRAELKNGDVIADACDQLGIDPGEIPEGDMNPSIGGNLLVYKLAANHLGLKGLSYKALLVLAASEQRFRAPFHVSDDAAAALRAGSTYNKSLIKRLGQVEMKSWARHDTLPQPDTLKQDLALILPEVSADELAQLEPAMASAAPWFDLDPAAG